MKKLLLVSILIVLFSCNKESEEATEEGGSTISGFGGAFPLQVNASSSCQSNGRESTKAEISIDNDAISITNYIYSDINCELLKLSIEKRGSAFAEYDNSLNHYKLDITFIKTVTLVNSESDIADSLVLFDPDVCIEELISDTRAITCDVTQEVYTIGKIENDRLLIGDLGNDVKANGTSRDKRYTLFSENWYSLND